MQQQIMFLPAFPIVDFITLFLNAIGFAVCTYFIARRQVLGQFVTRISPVLWAVLGACALGVVVELVRQTPPYSTIWMLRRELDQTRDLADAFAMLLLVKVWYARRHDI
jgi:hypothetical protein